MKAKAVLPLLLAALLLTAGCQAAFEPQRLIDRYDQGSLRAEYGITTHAGFCAEYRLDCRTEGDGWRVTILQPESVAGVSAAVERGKAQLYYDGLSLDALLPEYPGYSPMDALCVLLEEAGSRQPDSYALENGCWVVEYRGTQGQTEILKRAAFSQETLDLASAELYLDGSLILSLQPQTFQWTPEGE